MQRPLSIFRLENIIYKDVHSCVYNHFINEPQPQWFILQCPNHKNRMLKSCELLLTIRLWFYSMATLHLIFLAIIILPIDMSEDGDPRVSMYIRVRWKLITCWFNLIMLAYFPICFYCDWKEKHGKWTDSGVMRLRKIRDNIMTGILFPVTLYSDVTFWILWIKDPALIAPVAIFTYLPSWAQHSLHTVSALVVLIDLLILPRRRPQNMWPGIRLMLAFSAVYAFVLLLSSVQGEAVYRFLELYSTFEVILFVIFTMAQLFLYNAIQWHIIDFRWGRNDSVNYTRDSVESHKIK